MDYQKKELLNLAWQAIQIRKLKEELQEELREIELKRKTKEKLNECTPENIINHGGFYQEL